ncbi:MAG: WbqC family protein [Candidatus Rokuibacteriota bacterium]
MKVAIHQPHYLPWLGYLAKWAAADCFVFLDTVQFEKNGWQNRNRIKTRDGVRWLTVPVHARLGAPIHEVEVDATQPWRARHLRTIELAYTAAPHLARHHADLERFYAGAWPRLDELAVASATWLARATGIHVPARRASELEARVGVRSRRPFDGRGEPAAIDPTDRLVALCRAVGADTYLAGRDGARYMDPERFRAAGISVLYQAYTHPVYTQLHGEFVPSLSALDLLLMHGDESLGILCRGDRWSPEPPGD